MNLQKTYETLFADRLNIESSAWETGYYLRKPKKITASVLFSGFWKMQQQGQNTLRKWCLYIGEQIGSTVEKESLNERFNERSTELCKTVLKKPLQPV